MSTPTHPPPSRQRLPRRGRARLGSTVLLAAVVGAWAVPAWAADLSPTTVDGGVDVAFAVTVAGGGVDLLQSVGADLPADFAYVGCNAPQGWSCGLDGSAVRWNRDTSLSGEDTTFGMTLTTPETAGDRIFGLSERHASGSASSSNAVVTVVAADGVDATDEPTDEPTAEASPEETSAEVVDDHPAPPVEPFRPPDGEDPPPISIRDLPDVDASDAAVATSSAGRGVSTTTLVVAPMALLLLLSFAGFLTAALNR